MLTTQRASCRGMTTTRHDDVDVIVTLSQSTHRVAVIRKIAIEQRAFTKRLCLWGRNHLLCTRTTTDKKNDELTRQEPCKYKEGNSTRGVNLLALLTKKKTS